MTAVAERIDALLERMFGGGPEMYSRFDELSAKATVGAGGLFVLLGLWMLLFPGGK